MNVHNAAETSGNQNPETPEPTTSGEPVALTSAHILIVDDEESICRSLGDALRDEGFEVTTVSSGEDALRELTRGVPALVLLDIWLPGMDGMEVLRKMVVDHPELPIIMMSGHATIATAVAATRAGALDFVEKPLDLNQTISSVKRAINPELRRITRGSGVAEGEPAGTVRRGERDKLPLQQRVFDSQTLRGRKIPQRTIAQSTILYGQGLHSGTKSGLIVEPLPPNSGIHFAGVNEPVAVPAHVDFVESTGFATTVRLGQTQAGTIEHLMSALNAYGISNLLIKCNGEVPVLDGSARQFCELLEDVGIVEQPGDWFEIEIREPLSVERGSEFIRIEPADNFTVEYRLRYAAPVGEQVFSFTMGDVEAYKREIAPARTFGFVKDIGWLQQQGLALGGRFDNFVLFGEKGPLNGQLRFPDEPVRHKVLDAIGDLYLLGRPLRGKVTAALTGHSDNVALLKLVRDALRMAVR